MHANAYWAFACFWSCHSTLNVDIFITNIFQLNVLMKYWNNKYNQRICNWNYVKVLSVFVINEHKVKNVFLKSIENCLYVVDIRILYFYESILFQKIWTFKTKHIPTVLEFRIRKLETKFPASLLPKLSVCEP